jgi:hypothetical protein
LFLFFFWIRSVFFLIILKLIIVIIPSRLPAKCSRSISAVRPLA